VDRSRIPLFASYVVILSLAALASGQTPETSKANDGVRVVTHRTSVHTQQDTVATFLKHMPFVWDHRFAHHLTHGSPAAQDPAMLMQQIARRPRARQAPWLSSGTNEAFLDSLEATSPPINYPIDGSTSQVTANRTIDWSVSLGAGNVAPLQYPGVYRASINTPDCLNDYVAFALNVAGVQGGQANLVGINQLYSGFDPNPLCNRTLPNVNWAYNGSTAHGKIITSPDINFLDPGVPDGTKIAYVESTATSSIFHVLTWKAGEGTSVTSAVNPTAFGSCTSTSSCLVSLTYSKKFSTTYASPMVDWRSDKAWVASDDGTVYQLSCALTCPLNTLPTIEWSFVLPVAGTGGALPKPSVPSYDLNNQLINITDQLGELWIINGAGTPTVFAGPLMIGGGGCSVQHPPGRTGTGNGTDCTANGGSYGLPDGVIEDDYDQLLYAFTGNQGTLGASAVLSQMNHDLTGRIQTTIGQGSAGNTTTNVDIHLPTFDNGWWQSQPTAAHIIVCGTSTTDTSPYLYSIGFSDHWPQMNHTALQGLHRIPDPGIPCSPLTEIYNANLNLGGFPNDPNDHDLLVSGLMDATYGEIITDDITLEPAAKLNTVAYPGGVSGVWWDNISTGQEASSVYFSTLGKVNVGTCVNARCAVKLSQLKLQ
jgi:hypothetical protein